MLGMRLLVVMGLLYMRVGTGFNSQHHTQGAHAYKHAHIHTNNSLLLYGEEGNLNKCSGAWRLFILSTRPYYFM